MLLELKVSNFAIIDSLHVTFEDGLNILSGETGAGKSVILKSLAMLMGEKALSDTVRSGMDQAVIEGSFEISDRPDIAERLLEMGMDISDETLIVRRVISSQGKSRVYVNGNLSALSNLRDIVAPLITVTGHSAPLIEMTGQHDNRHLQNKSYHLDVLDQYAGVWELRQKFSSTYQQLNDMESELEAILQMTREREQRLDFLKFQKEEIEALGLSSEDEETLQERFHKLNNSHRLVEFASLVESSLYSDDDSALVRIHRILQRAGELDRYDSGLKDRMNSLSQAKTLIEESVYDFREYGKDLEADPSELAEIEEKLTKLKRLQKKHGASLGEIYQRLEDIKSEIETLESSDDRVEQLQKEIKVTKKTLIEMAEDLHLRRLNASTLLSKGVNDELVELNMKGVQLVVNIRPCEMHSTGTSDVEFMTKSSKKDEPRPLSRFASGGELSRILLSLKQVVGQTDYPRTYLFDEVDTGVSGPTAEKVGRKLKSIAQGQQVICVTHLPQVACFADAHYLIEKETQASGIHMTVERLKKEQQVNEIARLISGEKISKTSLDHARQLLKAHPTA